MNTYEIKGISFLTVQGMMDIWKKQGYNYEVAVMQGPEYRYYFRAYGPQEFKLDLSETELENEKRENVHSVPFLNDFKTELLIALLIRISFREMIRLQLLKHI